MKQVEILKYQSQATLGDFWAAVDFLEELQERHPDREYTILRNNRAQYTMKFQVAQIKRVPVDVLEEEVDFRFPPKPRQDDPNYWKELHEWTVARNERRSAGQDIKAIVKEKMNP